jgi:hypothetical protein
MIRTCLFGALAAMCLAGCATKKDLSGLWKYNFSSRASWANGTLRLNPNGTYEAIDWGSRIRQKFESIDTGNWTVDGDTLVLRSKGKKTNYLRWNDTVTRTTKDRAADLRLEITNFAPEELQLIWPDRRKMEYTRTFDQPPQA